MRILAETLNFNIEFQRPSDGGMWGWQLDNGSWTGLMGDLLHRKADIAVADLYIMETYYKLIGMSVAYDIEYLCFVNNAPGPLPQWMALHLPLNYQVWIAVFISVFCGIIVFLALAYFGRVAGLKDNDLVSKVANDVLLIYCCVVNTSWNRLPSTTHLQIFIGMWSIAFIILAVAYKGSLVSYLTIPLDQPPINTHKELYDKGVTVGSIGYTFKGVMERNANPWVRLLAEKFVHVPTTDEGLNRTVKGKIFQ